MTEKKAIPKSTKSSSSRDLYTIDEVVSAADAIQNRRSPPKTKKGLALHEALEPYITPSPDGVRIYIAKFYDAEGDVLRIRRYDEVDSPIISIYGYDNIKDDCENNHPQGAVYCRVFVSYDKRTLDPKPLWEFPLYELDLETPDFPTE